MIQKKKTGFLKETRILRGQKTQKTKFDYIILYYILYYYKQKYLKTLFMHIIIYFFFTLNFHTYFHVFRAHCQF